MRGCNFKQLQFETVRCASGTPDFARASKAYRTLKPMAFEASAAKNANFG
jgi:hypothetical protein